MGKVSLLVPMLWVAVMGNKHICWIEPYTFSGIKMSFENAIAFCVAENGYLYHPKDHEEIHQLVNMMIDKGASSVWVDRDKNGFSIENINEPYKFTYSGNNDECVVLFSNSTFDNNHCEIQQYYFCEHNNLCEPCDMGYVHSSITGSCYKVHTRPRNWWSALLACQTEGATLAIINSHEEADFLVREMFRYPSEMYPGDYLYDIFHIGFNDLVANGVYLTVENKSLAESGYEKWYPGQPDNLEGVEHCGTIFRDGTLNDLDCYVSAMFICEKPAS